MNSCSGAEVHNFGQNFKKLFQDLGQHLYLGQGFGCLKYLAKLPATFCSLTYGLSF